MTEKEQLMANTLKVVFKSDIRGIAKAGDVKKVSPGFARNYLFPRQLAFPATDAALKQWETVRQGTVAKTQRQRESSETLAQKIESASCALSVKAGADGRLFGSVGKQEIIDLLAKQGLKLEKQSLVLPKPIKQLGDTVVAVKLPSGVQAKLTVNVTAESNS
jgi:large subunit ribosomal protein L9